MKHFFLSFGLLAVAQGLVLGSPIVASPPQGTSLVLYDTGSALVAELRSFSVTKGVNEVVFEKVAGRLDPSTISLAPLGSDVSIEILEHSFQPPPRGFDAWANRWRLQPVEITAGSHTATGFVDVIPLPVATNELPMLMLRARGGTRHLYPNPTELTRISWTERGAAEQEAGILRMRLKSSAEGVVRVRLWYVTHGLGWEPSYVIVVPASQPRARFSFRATLRNASGVDFENAALSVAAAQMGQAEDGPAGYVYGEERIDRVSPTVAPIRFAMSEPLTLRNGETRQVTIHEANSVEVRLNRVYDGVRFDRFKRNRLTDWNYGTEFQRTVETRLLFDNTEVNGLGKHWPRGPLHIYEVDEEGNIMRMATSQLPATPPQRTADVSLGPAFGLYGERERTGYAEIVPLKEHEESFEIRLVNETEEEVEIRVIEHLYRGGTFSIVKTDTNFEQIGPQTIEFRPTVAPGARKALHYTVRYRW